MHQAVFCVGSRNHISKLSASGSTPKTNGQVRREGAVFAGNVSTMWRNSGNLTQLDHIGLRVGYDMQLRVALLAGINALLLGTTAVSAADLIIETPIVEEAASTFVLTVGAGVAAYNLPDFSGPIAETSSGPLLDLDGVALGGIVGFGASTQLGSGDGYVSSLGMSGFLSFATRSSSGTVELENDDFLLIQGLTTPDGTITLATDPAAPSAATAVAGAGAIDQVGVANPMGPGVQNGYGVDQTGLGDEFSYVGLATFTGAPENLAYAFGAIATDQGGVFLAVGDLAGWEVTTDVTQNLLYAGGDITFSLSSAPGTGEVAVSGYVGPSYRFLGQDITSEISVDVAEIQPDPPVDFTYPTYTQTTDETLSTHYLGGVVGGNISMPLGDTSSLTLGLEGGLYATNTTYEGSETYEVTGGVPLDGTASVENAIGVSDEEDGVAYALRSQATYTTAISNGMQFSLGLGAEYLSQVATISRDPISGVTNVGNETAVYDGATSTTNNLISFGDMWSVTLTGSITGQF